MSAAEVTQYLIFGTVALGGAIALVIGFAWGLQFEPYIRKVSIAILPTILLFGLGAGTLFSARDTSFYGLPGQLVSLGQSSSEVWILRLSTALPVGISLLVVAAGLLNRQKQVNVAKPLFLAFCLYFFSAYVVSGIFGSDATMSYKTFYPFVLVFALYITSDCDEKLMLRLTRDSLMLLLLAGLFLIFIKPDLVMQKYYNGFIPGLTGRFWGLASHANNIGPVAIFTFLIICWVPYKGRTATVVAVSICALTLLLAQSKTSFVAAILVSSVLLGRIWFFALFDKKSSRATSIFAIGLAMCIAVLVLFLFVADLLSQPVEQLLSKIQGRGTYFTGREDIWSITLVEWQKNPIFGYGPNLWGEEFSARYGYLGVASNAHNQLFDTLGSAGILGVTGLVIYCVILSKYALQLASSTKWISVALLVFLITRCFTEVPLKTMNITTSDFIMHAIVIGLFMRTAVQRAKPAVDGHSPVKYLGADPS